MAKKSASGRKKVLPKRALPPPPSKKDHVYALEVNLIDGPVTEEFVEANERVIRTIELRGDQTLEDLHFAIFKAFDRFDEHMFEFQFGKEPMSKNARCYVMHHALDDLFRKPAGTVGIALNDLNLLVREFFWYWFDFGDDWWHKITVVDVGTVSPGTEYPRVIKRVGESPPQYAGLEDEDEEWDEEDEAAEDSSEEEEK